MKTENPISERQLEANRRNAQDSTGPRGEEGKQMSSPNSLRHGFTGKVNLRTPENREAHDKFCDEPIESLNSETPMERQFAHSIAEDSWGLNGLRAAENNTLADAAGMSQNEAGEGLELKSLQAERKAQRDQALEEVKLLTRHSVAAGSAYNPASDPNPNGFVFSSVEVNRAIDRDNRLKQARDLTPERHLTRAA